jgi:hypothetical protein
MNRRTFCQCVLLSTLAVPLPARAAPIQATLYKSPQCSCCEGYAAYLQQNGFVVVVKPTNDLAQVSQNAGVGNQARRHRYSFGDPLGPGQSLWHFTETRFFRG